MESDVNTKVNKSDDKSDEVTNGEQKKNNENIRNCQVRDFKIKFLLVKGALLLSFQIISIGDAFTANECTKW